MLLTFLQQMTFVRTGHLYKGLASYTSAKSSPRRRSLAVLVTSSAQVAGLYPSRISDTPSMACGNGFGMVSARNSHLIRPRF